MTEWINPSAIGLVVVIVALSLPLLSLTYYFLRLGVRRNILLSKIREFGLENEYLRVFHSQVWQGLHERAGASANQLPGPETIRETFEESFKKQFQWDNSWASYFLPQFFTLLTTVLFALVILSSLLSTNSLSAFLANGILPFAITGALLYVFPLYIARFASFSLNPTSLLDLFWKLWLSVIIGVASASVAATSLQPIAAFVGGLLPVATLDLLKKKVFDKLGETGEPGEAERKALLLELVELDGDLLSQLYYIGIRSVLELAYENPLKVFVETDINLDTCIYLVDKANLYLYIPDKEIRHQLNHHGIKTAVELMTQVYENDRWISLEEKLTPELDMALTEIAQAMGLSLASFRNLLTLMIDDPKLNYLLDFWLQVTPGIEKLNVNQVQSETAEVPAPTRRGTTFPSSAQAASTGQ